MAWLGFDLTAAAEPALAAIVLHISMPAVVCRRLAGGDGTSTGGMLTTTAANLQHLHLFMHDEHTGPTPTAVLIVNGTGAPVTGDVRFGDTVVMDNVLTEGPTRDSRHVGRAQGTYVTTSLPREGPPAMLVSMNLVLTAGSTVTVVGRNDVTLPVRELAVVGGTGSFRMATGYVLWKTRSWRPKSAVLELDVYLRTTT
nr:unnamed protein product [Digitaria exilis]